MNYRRFISYIILLSIFLVVFLFAGFYLNGNKFFVSNILLFSFTVSFIKFIILDKIQKFDDKKRVFTTLVLRVIKLLLYLSFSLYIVFNADSQFVKKAILLYVMLYFITSFLEIVHVIYFQKKRKCD